MEGGQSGERGLRTIGSLTSKTGNTPSFEVTTGDGSRSRPGYSATATLPQARNTPIGMPRGVHGSGALTTSAVAIADPDGTDRAIVKSLPRSVASILHPILSGDCHRVGYCLDGEAPMGDLRSAREVVAGHLRPAPAAVIRQELARLRASTKARDEGDDDLAMRLQVLAEVCAEWPADVVVAALRGWAKAETFFPSLAEIRDALQRNGRPRQSMLRAIEEGLMREPLAPPPPPPTEAEKRAVSELVAQCIRALSAGGEA